MKTVTATVTKGFVVDGANYEVEKSNEDGSIVVHAAEAGVEVLQPGQFRNVVMFTEDEMLDAMCFASSHLSSLGGIRNYIQGLINKK